jgi:hypothetical protein
MLVVALTAGVSERNEAERNGSAVAAQSTYLNKGNLMNDLNFAYRDDSGWDSIEYWMEAVEYWSDRVATYGDVNGYGRSVQLAWNMVNLELCGEYCFPVA